MGLVRCDAAAKCTLEVDSRIPFKADLNYGLVRREIG
jgi:hypothetical protein